jgi:cyclophilin family peptidyl-prolyl cis-trans isomerase
MIQGGDPNSKDANATATWGQGGPGYTLPQEQGALYHFAGVLSMAKKESDWESSGSQFFITVAPAHHLDGQYTIIGAVIEGMDVAKQIASGEIAKDTADRPATPAILQSAEVL